MAHPLDGAGLKVKRANQQIQNIWTGLEAFRKREPHGVRAERDEQARQLTFIFLQDPFPPLLPLVVGEFIHNLHSALDHLVWELVILETGVPSKSTKLQFPIFLDPTGYANRGLQKLAGIGPKARAIIEELQPFRTGEGSSSPLWQLYQLSVWDKHKSLALCTMIPHGFRIGPFPTEHIEEMWASPPGILKHEAVMGWVRFKPSAPFPTASPMKMDAYIAYQVAFEQPESVRGKELFHTINAFGERVADILYRFYTEWDALT
jgi:hypothetical protein